MVTFSVADVKLGEPIKGTQTVIQAIHGLIKVAPEAAAGQHDTLSSYQVSKNCFINAVDAAFNGHLPLTLSPDAVWLAIAQGFAKHVNQNAEALRHKFVKHAGKAQIIVQRDSFVKGSAANDWTNVFAEFSDKIGEHLGKQRDLVICNFTTTDAIAKAASEIVLMDAMQAYFSYGVRTLCGIPSITLTGVKEDWMQIRERAYALSEYDCQDWVEALVLVLDMFVKTFDGSADPKFWNSIYHEDGGSGGPYISGWINVFFPYLGTRKTFVNPESKLNYLVTSGFNGYTPDNFPIGMASAPFTWEYYAQSYPMKFMGGFVGIAQDVSTLSVAPSIGWAVSDDK